MDLNELLEAFYEIKSKSTNPEFGFSDDWITFVKKMVFLSPKSRGSRIQNRIIKLNNGESVSSSDEKGDFKLDGKFYEIKTSLLDATNKTIHIVGIREWQDIDGYFILVIDAQDYKAISTFKFFLTKEQMSLELKQKNAQASSGTKEANKDNLKVAKRFSIEYNGTIFNGWKKQYKTDKIEL